MKQIALIIVFLFANPASAGSVCEQTLVDIALQTRTQILALRHSHMSCPTDAQGVIARNRHASIDRLVWKCVRTCNFKGNHFEAAIVEACWRHHQRAEQMIEIWESNCGVYGFEEEPAERDEPSSPKYLDF